MTLLTNRAPSDVGGRPWRGSDDASNIVVPILRSGILARQFCQRGRHAEVEAVFERSFYLRTGDKFVCVGEPAIGDGPLTLIADFSGAHRLAGLGLCPGQPVCLSEKCITIDDVVELTFDRCEPWHQPRWPASRSLGEMSDLCSAIARRMELECPREGLGRMCLNDAGAGKTALARVVGPRLARFESWLVGALQADVPMSASAEPIAGLVGLGPGLTPSGDDFLIGALALLDALSVRKAYAELANALAIIPHGLTSALSECLLKTAAAGHLGADLCYAVSAVVSGSPDRAVVAIRKIGHTSGWDMMAGIVTTLRVVTRDATRNGEPA